MRKWKSRFNPSTSIKTSQMFERARLATARGDVASAMQAIEELLDTDPNYEPALSYIRGLFCPHCQQYVKWPFYDFRATTYELRRFWRGNCPICETALIPCQIAEANKRHAEAEAPPLAPPKKARAARPLGSAPKNAVFRPVQAIAWPECCIGCMSAGPLLTLTLNVHQATWQAAGAKVGNFAGGVIVPLLGGAVGAVVGGAAGAMAGAVASEVRDYELPICSPCLASLCKEEVESLENATKERTQTKLLTRTIQKSCVILNFTCRPYMEAFWASNAGRVYGTVEECRAGKPG